MTGERETFGFCVVVTLTDGTVELRLRPNVVSAFALTVTDGIVRAEVTLVSVRFASAVTTV